MRTFSNYVFDLYGTLVDVHTDENKPALWQFMAGLYSAWGCLLSPDDLRDAFWRTDADECAAARRASPGGNPEIRIDRVFLRLLLESPSRPSSTPLAGRPAGHWRRRYARNPEAVLRALEPDGWTVAAANAFRVLSRDRLAPYPDTIPTLRELLRRGKRIYLLTNAQAVFTRPEIERTGLAEFFPAPRFSSEAGMMKPQREFLETLLRDENLDPADTAYVGNEFSTDMALALRCRATGIHLNTAALPYSALQAQAAALLASEHASPGSLLLLPSGLLRDLLA